MVTSHFKIIKYQGKEDGTMKELEKKMQNENFDVEVQYCDPDDCWHDCQTAPKYCNAHSTECWEDGGMLYGKKNSGRIV